MIPILGTPRTTLPDLSAWATAKLRGSNRVVPPQLTPALSALWSAALVHHLVPEVLVAQACKETAYFTYLRPDRTPSPAMKVTYHNTAGLKPRDGAANDEPHAQFATWHQGATAHAQHLCGYLGVVIPDTVIVDPRYVWVGPGTAAFGSVHVVEDLGGRWAPAPDYGISVVHEYLSTMPGWDVP